MILFYKAVSHKLKKYNFVVLSLVVDGKWFKERKNYRWMFIILASLGEVGLLYISALAVGVWIILVFSHTTYVL